MTTTESISYTIAPPRIPNEAPTTLALDASSVAIGWCLFDGTVIDSGEITLLDKDINKRCREAYWRVGLLIVNCHYAIDVCAIESPVARFAKAVIPQALVSGAIRACVTRHELLICDVTPSSAKRALTGFGNADKEMMQRAAACYGVKGEHASDALGVAKAAAGMVKVER
jgi:Holliday junction resolvasome RuvABC endonuclease subunit